MATFLEMLQEALPKEDLDRLMAWMGGMPPEQQAAMMQFITDRDAKAPAVGSPAPDFELPLRDGGGIVRLSSFRGDRPVALVFGSYT